MTPSQSRTAVRAAPVMLSSWRPLSTGDAAEELHCLRGAMMLSERSVAGERSTKC
jgi:hypothetical protein